MKTLHRNHDPPSDNAERLVPAYHAAALLPTANTIAHKYITNVYSIKSIAVVCRWLFSQLSNPTKTVSSTQFLSPSHQQNPETAWLPEQQQ